MKPGQTGVFHRPNPNPYELGDFISARIIEADGGVLLVETEDGQNVYVSKDDFKPKYMTQKDDRNEPR